jgi:hypothetical protein
MRLRLGQIRDEFALFLAQWPFEWLATLTFKFPVEQEIGRKRLIRWTREICIKEHLQVSFVAVFNQMKHDHLHVLMLGKSKVGKTLAAVSADKWCNFWVEIRGGRSEESRSNQWTQNPGELRRKKWHPAVIQVLDNNIYGVASYVSSRRNFSFDDPERSGIFIYNQSLLEKVRKRPVRCTPIENSEPNQKEVAMKNDANEESRLNEEWEKFIARIDQEKQKKKQEETKQCRGELVKTGIKIGPVLKSTSPLSDHLSAPPKVILIINGKRRKEFRVINGKLTQTYPKRLGISNFLEVDPPQYLTQEDLDNDLRILTEVK